MSTSVKNNKDHQWVFLTGKEIYQFLHKVKGRFKGITVYALVGKSGTGKSFRAKLLAEKIGIPYVIDDGLLIHGETILAGWMATKCGIRSINPAHNNDWKPNQFPRN